MNAEHVLDGWARHPERGRPFVAHHVQEARAARHAPVPDWLAEPVRQGLAQTGIEQLYTHQAEALEHVRGGHDVVVATPTASGKTLVYNLPVLSAISQRPEARALYLFPTKALAHDQVAAVEGLGRACDLKIAAHAYDGDTPPDARRAIRRAAQVVVTNPDMLHSGILPQHDRWHGLFAELRYVVLDEIHSYRGIFGSHVANVVRRLRRICRFHDSKPQFVMCSATIANATEHAASLIEAPVRAVTESGAPSGRRSFYIYNPPLTDGAKGIRQSYVQAARRITRSLAKQEVPTIVFANSRLNVERLTRHLQGDVAADGGNPETVSGYRGGYLPDHRRGIERALRAGAIKTIVSTSALELGIDVGQLEACVLAGYPGSIASSLQRAGRAGRRESPAAVVLVARSEPTDQYLARHPEYFFERSPEHARLHADHLLVVADHIKCAAFELPFATDEAFGGFGAEGTREILSWLQAQRVVLEGMQKWQWTGAPYPAHGVGLRSIAEGNFTVLDRGHGFRIIGEVDYHAAAEELYPQAIYIVGGRTWQVMELDWVGRRAIVDPVEVDYFTTAMTHDGVRPLETFEVDVRPFSELSHGEVHVYSRVVGFKKIRWATNENVGYGEVKLPENELHTTAFWLRPTQGALGATGLPRHRIVDALEGLAVALRHVAAVHLMCDPGDLGWAVAGDEVDTLPALFLYEKYPGGVGFHEGLWTARDTLLDSVAGLLQGCRCTDGCPGCVGASALPQHQADTPRSRGDAAALVAAIQTTSLRLAVGG